MLQNFNNMESENSDGSSRRSFLKSSLAGLAYLSARDIAKAMHGENENKNKIETEGSEKLVLSWSTLNGKMPVEKNVQKIVAEKFSGLATVIWREADLASEQSNQIQVICLPDLKPERMLKYGIKTLEARQELVGCAPQKTGKIRFDNRIFISLEGVKGILRKGSIPISQGTLSQSLATAIAHEIIHVVLGSAHPHSKKGLFSSKLDYGTQIEPETQKQFRMAINNNKHPLESIDSSKDNTSLISRNPLE